MIKVVHYGLSNRLGGIETYLYKLSQHIDRSQFEFSFIWEGNDTPCFYNELKEMGFLFIHICSRRESYIKNRADLENVFRDGAYDVLHCHLNTLSYVEPIKAALRYKCKVILHSRNGSADQTRFYTMWLHKLHFRWIGNQDIVRLAVSDVAARWLFGEKKSIVINNGIDTGRFRFHIQEREKIRTELGIGDKTVYGHVGSFSLQKNHMLLLEIFAEIVKKEKKSYLLLLGDGVQRLNIEKKISELKLTAYVGMLGNQLSIERYLWAMDVFLFPSKFEGFPNAVLEAQTAGLPCVIADTITREVVLLETTVLKKLEDNVEEWARTALCMKNTQNNRSSCADKIEDTGFSVISETRKIEKIYRDNT